MKKTCLLLALCVWLYPATSETTEVSFLKFCEYMEVDSEALSKDAKAVTISCVAFIKGVVESHTALVQDKKIKPQFCKPSSLSYGKIGMMYIKYAKNHSQKTDQSDADFLLQALRKSYPCK